MSESSPAPADEPEQPAPSLEEQALHRIHRILDAGVYIPATLLSESHSAFTYQTTEDIAKLMEIRYSIHKGRATEEMFKDVMDIQVSSPGMIAASNRLGIRTLGNIQILNALRDQAELLSIKLGRDHDLSHKLARLRSIESNFDSACVGDRSERITRPSTSVLIMTYYDLCRSMADTAKYNKVLQSIGLGHQPGPSYYGPSNRLSEHLNNIVDALTRVSEEIERKPTSNDTDAAAISKLRDAHKAIEEARQLNNQHQERPVGNMQFVRIPECWTVFKTVGGNHP